jgi:hypothetical protein
MEEDTIEAQEKAAKNAKRFMVVTAILVMVSIAVVAIDNTIKSAIIAEGKKAQELLDEFRALVSNHTVSVEVNRDGAEEAGKAGIAAGDGIDPGNGVVHDAPAGEVLGQAADAPGPAADKHPARPAGRAPGNGRRATRQGPPPAVRDRAPHEPVPGHDQ